MNQRLSQIAERRQRLIDEIARQRSTLSNDIEPWRSALATADQGIAALRYLGNHPYWLVGGGALVLAVAGPGRVWKWLGRGVLAWRMISPLRMR